MNEHFVYLYSDESSQTSTLFYRIGYSLVDRRILNLLIIVSKTIINYRPEYLRDQFGLTDKSAFTKNKFNSSKNALPVFLI